MKSATVMRSIFIVVLIAFAALVSFAEGQQEDNKLVVATDATWPPMEFINEDKELVGFDIDLMNAAAEAGGFEVEFKNTAWDGIFAGLGNKNYDAVISSVTITEDRKKSMDFSIPYINAGQVLIVRKDTSGVTTLADLKGKAAGAQIGTTGAMEIQKVDGVELKTYDELGLAIEDLANGRIAGVVADTPIAADYALQNDKYSDTLQIVGEPFTNEYYGVAVRKGNDRVLKMINEGLKKVLDQGVDEELKDKWLR
jgi:polar amino acid transport system substrate-binding protein